MFGKIHASDEDGFTLIELMIVIAIIGVLAAIAIPNFQTYRQRGFNAASNSDLENAYIATQAYYSDYKDGTVSLAVLNAYGYVQTTGVALDIVSGTRSALQITAAHSSGSKTYTIDSTGHISK